MLESKRLQEVTDHPVHIINKEKELSPTALIPFCEFGGNMSVMGVKIDQFDDPVCSSFRPKIIKDQLCYTVDPNEYKDEIDLKGDLSLSLFINYNEERQMASGSNELVMNDNSIIIETIGKMMILILLGNVGKIFFSRTTNVDTSITQMTLFHNPNSTKIFSQKSHTHYYFVKTSVNLSLINAIESRGEVFDKRTK